MQRALAEARHARGSTAPNPLVGAVVERDGIVLASAHHAEAGTAHAEAIALQACADPRGATLYVTLEPCVHHGRQPPCVDAIVRAGIARVVVGAIDPDPRVSGRGIEALRQQGVAVELLDDPDARRLIEDFAVWVRAERPYVALKMAVALDGAITSEPGVQQWITSDAERAYVRELRIAHDAVMVGAGTVRVDDPLLTVRPAHDRARPYRRIVACETAPVDAACQLFAPLPGYAPTLVLAPAGARTRFRALEAVAEMLYVGEAASERLDLPAAMRALRAREVYSILCEGGPTLASRLLADGLVDRFYWAIAPIFLSGRQAVPVLSGSELAPLGLKGDFDTVERVGADVVLSGRMER